MKFVNRKRLAAFIRNNGDEELANAVLNANGNTRLRDIVGGKGHTFVLLIAYYAEQCSGVTLKDETVNRNPRLVTILREMKNNPRNKSKEKVAT